MNDTGSARSATSRASRLLRSGIAVLVAAIFGTFGCSTVTSSAASFGELLLAEHHHGALVQADGVVPDGTTLSDDDVPAVANLDSQLLHALRQAAADAEDEGVEVYVTSGWRSRSYQEQLFRDAVSTHGSAGEAARWVARPGTSAHEAGDAVDLGHSAATAWLSEYGAAYGLCQIYRNEPWHYELRPDAVADGCPPMYADPTHDPRLTTTTPRETP